MNCGGAISEVVPIPDAARVAGVEEHQVTIDNVTWRYLRSGSPPTLPSSGVRGILGSNSRTINSGAPGISGAKPPLVLVHGLMGYSWSWRFNMQELGRHFTVYAPDLPGCGFSQRADCLPGSLESDAEGLLKFLDHLGVDEFNLLGTSRGGGVAIVLASLLAQRGSLHRMRRMILSAPINPWSKFGQARARLMAKGLGRLYTLYGAKRTPFLFEHYFRELYGDVARIAPGSQEGYQAGLEPPRSFHHLLGMLRQWFAGLNQVKESLPLLQDLPILLLWGDRDRAVYPSSAYELHQRLDNSAVLMMKGVGHLPYEEVPADFNRILCDFFLRHEPRTPLEITASSHAEGSLASAESAVEPSQVNVSR